MKRESQNWKCVVCEKDVGVTVYSSEHPEAPDMMAADAGAVLGIVRDSGHTVSMIATCGHECTTKLYESEEQRFVICATHGRKPWRGEIVCAACERVYTTHDDTLPTDAPEMCSCGSALLPSSDKGKGEFSGRMVCSECYASRVGARRGSG